jgi:hypothetical protein
MMGSVAEKVVRAARASPDALRLSEKSTGQTSRAA